jgi:hypothetical protein
MCKNPRHLICKVTSCGQVQIVTIQTLDVQGDLERIEDRMLTSGQVK